MYIFKMRKTIKEKEKNIVSKAFDRFNNTVPVYTLLSRHFLPFSISEMKANCVVNVFSISIQIR